MFQSLWAYRYFIISSIRNDLQVRFAHSKLGALWAVFNPLAQVAIYALILSNVLAAKLPGIENKFAFAIYLMAGTLGWALFAEIIQRGVSMFVDNANLLKKINFPRVTLPTIMLGSCLLNNLILLSVILVIYTLLGQPLGLSLLWLIPLTGTLVLIALGLSLILGVLNVFVRDISQIVPISLQILFWFTPIVYPIAIIPPEYLHWLYMNPLVPLIEAYHNILVYNQSPDMTSLLYLNLLGVGVTVLGLFMFRRASSEMVDVL